MIGKNVVGNRPVTLAEVSSILEKRMEEAEAEMKKMKKEKKVVVEAPPTPPAAPVEGGEGIEGAAAVPVAPVAPVEEKSPLGLEQRNALEYSKKFAKFGKRKAVMNIDGMKAEAATKIVDIMPKSREQVKHILTKERIPAADKDADAVLKAIDSFRK